MKTLILIPTYNERENVRPIVTEVFKWNPDVHVLVIDDNSPDKTAEIVQEMMKADPRLHLLSRSGKQGLGKAYLAGFEWGQKNGFELLCEMDADFSHRPEDLKKILSSFTPETDFIIGSRYVPGGDTVNWSWFRRLISRGGSLYAGLVLKFKVSDYTGGFNCWRSRTLDKIGLSTVTSNGYCFQIELKYKALKAGCRVQEVPIIFEDRRVGQSKMSTRIVLEAFYKVWQIR
jgi:dolichol-phosphate mannosyltransferase